MLKTFIENLTKDLGLDKGKLKAATKNMFGKKIESLKNAHKVFEKVQLDKATFF